jgi:hypothetical protein
MKTNQQSFKIICPFCSEELPLKVQVHLDSTSEGCETCGHGAKAYGIVEIKCPRCNKVIYKKEWTEIQ